MSTITTTYNQYSFLTEDRRAAVRGFLDRQKARDNESGQAKPAGADDVAFSERSKKLADSGRLSPEEMERLSYEPFFTIETEDGGTIAIALARDPQAAEGEETYLAARVTVTKPDGTEEVLYLSMTPPPPPEEDEAEESAVEEDAEGQAQAVMVEDAEPSLKELIQKYGLDKIADPSESLAAAIQARIAAMIEASRETREEEEALNEARALREERKEIATEEAAADAEVSAEAFGEASGDEEDARSSGAVSVKTARSLASYARNSSVFTPGTGNFSRRY